MEDVRDLKDLIEGRQSKAHGAATVWDRVRRGKAKHDDTEWPGMPDVKVRIVILTSSEEQAATAAAFKRFAELELPLNPITADEYASEEVTQRLALALRDPATEELAFETAAHLRDCSTTDERYSLWAQYQALASDLAPDLNALDPDEFDKIREAVKKKDVALLNSFGRRALATYLLTTADQQSNSPTGSSTPGA